MINMDKYKYKYNPNVVSKIFVTIVLGTTVMHPLREMNTILIVLIYFILYCINKDYKNGIKIVAIYSCLLYIVTNTKLDNANIIITMFATIIITIKIFFLPFIAGAFFIKTSDVGSIISAMDMLKISRSFSIPIAVMFRFFPSFHEEKEHIIMAMKIKGITFKRPLKYLEYVGVPLLMVSSIITDDIAKTAETKCIANPIKKVRYRKFSFTFIDGLFICGITSLLIGGSLW